eukprot:1575800-Rhodomonas_salina.1
MAKAPLRLKREGERAPVARRPRRIDKLIQSSEGPVGWEADRVFQSSTTERTVVAGGDSEKRPRSVCKAARTAFAALKLEQRKRVWRMPGS